MECICVKECQGPKEVNRKFVVGDIHSFEVCPPYFEPVATAAPVVVEPEPEEPRTFSELQEKTLAEEASGRPTEEERDGANIFEGV